jgi:hypothetical protein
MVNAGPYPLLYIKGYSMTLFHLKCSVAIDKIKVSRHKNDKDANALTTRQWSLSATSPIDIDSYRGDVSQLADNE